MIKNPLPLYQELKHARKSGKYGAGSHAALLGAVTGSMEYLARHERVSLKSKVENKSYHGYKSTRVSRAINDALYAPDAEWVAGVLRKLLENDYLDLTPGDVNRAVYTAAISFCASIDLLKNGDQKTPGTFFEYLCACILQSITGATPANKVPVQNFEFKTGLPTDYIFDLGPNKPRLHVPVKTSTRERIIQVWAHQRVLDGVFGHRLYNALPVILTETKTDTAKLEVTEICLPDQWQLYQRHIAELWRIAFLDIPAAYAKLGQCYPPVPVTTLGSVLFEKPVFGAGVSNGDD